MGRAGTPSSARAVRRLPASGAAISARKRSNEHGHDAGMPRSSRYQLRQPVTQIVFFAASTRAASNASIAVPCRRDLAALAGAEPVDELHDVAELQLGDLDQREVADRTVRAVEHEEVREARAPRSTGTRSAARPTASSRRHAVAPDDRHRAHERVRLEAGREHEHVELVQPPSRVRTPVGSMRSIASVTSSAFGCWIAS